MAGPVVTFSGGLIVVASRQMHAEYGLSWFIVHIVAFGPVQWIWILPTAIVAVAAGKRGFAVGLLVGGLVLLAANGLALLIGLAIGAR